MLRIKALGSAFSRCGYTLELLFVREDEVRSLYRVGTLMTVSKELSRYELDLAGVQEVGWEGDGTVPAGK
jgi:hypothetical protein